MAAVTLRTDCPHCSARIRVRDDHIGKQVRCPTCSAVFKVASVHSTTESQSASPAAETMERAGDTAGRSVPGSGSPTSNSAPTRLLGRIGRFELREVLGQGGFGRVYRAYDPQLDREVALKVPTFGPHETQKIQRFV